VSRPAAGPRAGRLPRIHIRPGRRWVAPRPGETLLDAARRTGIPLGSSCGGVAACAACVVRVLRGAAALGRRGPAERRLAEREGFAAEERAACQVRPRGDATVTTGYW
jgi:ferredoxin